LQLNFGAQYLTGDNLKVARGKVTNLKSVLIHSSTNRVTDKKVTVNAKNVKNYFLSQTPEINKND
jgi:hypothetical protein